MTQEKDGSRTPRPGKVSRRRFIKLAAATGLLAGCSSKQSLSATPTHTPTEAPPPTTKPTATHTPVPPPTTAPTVPPTAVPSATPAAVPSATPTATATATIAAPPAQREIIQIYPDVPSKIVRTRHTGAWDGEALAPNAIRQILDASITELTGLNDTTEAWKALFDPGERIAIKVNTIDGSQVWTHVPLVMALAQSLQDAGIPAEQIVIFDRLTSELKHAGFPVNADGPGVRCYGTDHRYTSGWQLVDSDIKLSDVLLECDALINVPVLKVHSMAGLSLAMKNHYGTFDKPQAYHHGSQIRRGVAELNALAPIRERARLIVGDMLTASLIPRNRYPSWTLDHTGDSITMSFDPVAHDAWGLSYLEELIAASDENFPHARNLADPWLQIGASVGLGTNDLNNTELVELNVG